MPRSIRGRLLGVALAVALPAVLLAAWLIYETQQSHRALLERQLSETARALSLVVDRQLGQSEVLLRALATSPSLTQQDYAAFHAQARSLVPESSRWIVLTTVEGQQVVNTRFPWGTALPKNPLRPLDYAPGLAQNLTHVSNLIPSMVQRDRVLSVVVPIFRAERLTHALVLVTQPARLSSVLSDQRLPPEWIASILDRDGTIVARTRSAESFVGQPATQDVRAMIRQHASGSMESRTMEGAAVVAAFNRTPQYGWTVIVGAPSREIYAPASRLALIAVAVAFLVVAIGLAVSRRVARHILFSVDRVVEGAVQLGRAEEVSIGATGMRETDRIAQALSDSAAALRARESELRRLNETLEARVAERTGELADANRVLSIRNRELQDFAQIAAHDLQEPARRISTFSELLLEESGAELSPEARHYVERMGAAARRLSRLISDLLAFSAITAHTRPAVPVDLQQAVSTVLGDLEGRLADTGGRVEYAGLDTVEADPVQVHHLLLNLIGNALKFHRPGVAPLVRVSTVREGSLVRIVVEDNGVGFNPAYSGRLFTPFERLHSRDEYSGTGIGLAIVRRIAERHGGTVSASSTPNVGSRFEATLPAARGAAGAEAAPAGATV